MKATEFLSATSAANFIVYGNIQLGTKGKTEKLLLLDDYHVLKPYYVPSTGLRTFHALSHLNPRTALNYYPILSRGKTEPQKD